MLLPRTEREHDAGVDSACASLMLGVIGLHVGTDKSQYMHAFAYGVAVQLSRTEDKLKMAEDAQSAGYGGGGG